ncbi:protein-L-isoaspartate O-methyltransferase family protein [Noviherbaspirillum denitrificans]|uniref:Protein-L-isoaspartate O-methyltransferase n=1 Tax=Noviherbaspirillum denitrificans TaxID=1968433 RepID=A0A254T8Y0_9BURK|nr:protein-L-isoaspartate O-methyltransferase [Noviherbaspirillum denitrificans]OWW19111.1 protein-L-isoaspartate O-methyltransferase [Noviherbaspirillum denitrificans]
MNIEKTRFNMIEQQIRPWNVLDPEVLNLLTVVKREAFVPAAYKNLAFMDTQIPLGNGEFMFTPKMEARILQEVGVKKHEDVLEIGAGSGYMAALLAHKARHVTTVEIDPELKAFAAHNLTVYGIGNVDVALGNGAQGWSNKGTDAPYDVIVISASLPVLPKSFIKQLKVGGRLFAIVGESPVMNAEIITRVSDTAYKTVKVFETDVPPLREIEKPSHFVF